VAIDEVQLHRQFPSGHVPWRSVESVLRCPTEAAIACTSQPIRATWVRHRCRVAWVENHGTSAAARPGFSHARKTPVPAGWPRRYRPRPPLRDAGPDPRWLIGAACPCPAGTPVPAPYYLRSICAAGKFRLTIRGAPPARARPGRDFRVFLRGRPGAARASAQRQCPRLPASRHRAGQR
jgi:hypothetical protein